MLYRPLGTSGIDASVVAFGAWAIGGVWWGGSDEGEAIDAIHSALNAGINFIDTAPIYGFGKSESVIGKAVADCRDKVVIATKCGMHWDGQEVGQFHAEAPVPGSEKPVRIYRNLRPDVIRNEVEGSLKRLGTDYIDLYQTHWQDATTPIAETMDCLMALQAEGKIRAIGVSNASAEQIAAYRSIGAIHSDQEKFSMLDQDSAHSNLAYCAGNDLAFLAYSPLVHGLLTGKVDVARTFAEGDFRGGHEAFTSDNIERIHRLLSRLTPIATEESLTLAQLVIRWTFQQPGCTHAVVGARKAQQARENARAGEAPLGSEAVDAIRSALSEFASTGDD